NARHPPDSRTPLCVHSATGFPCLQTTNSFVRHEHQPARSLRFNRQPPKNHLGHRQQRRSPPISRFWQVLAQPAHRRRRHEGFPRRTILRRRHCLHLLRRQRQQISHLQNLRRRQNLAHTVFRPAPRLLPRRTRLPLRKRLLRHQRPHRRQIPNPSYRRRRALDRTLQRLRARRPSHRRPLRRQQLLSHPLRPNRK